MTRRRVGLLGAAGETGTSILEGLIQVGEFEIIALARPASLSKPANVALKDRGVEVRALDLNASEDSIVTVLAGIEILISAIGPREQLAQIPLVAAAKRAGVTRFLPCAFMPITPVGAHVSRDQKEDVYNLVKRLHLPYTIIDVGWWYQISFPALPSGKIDYAVGFPNITIPGNGNVKSALTDLRDIGKYVARIIKDERTLNKMVFVYNELWTCNEIYDLLERLSGEKIRREYTNTEKYENQISDANAKLEENPKDGVASVQKVGAQYFLSWGIRGENVPEFANYLGYLDGKKLYPDFKYSCYEDYLKEVIGGQAQGVYSDASNSIKEAFNKGR